MRSLSFSRGIISAAMGIAWLIYSPMLAMGREPDRREEYGESFLPTTTEYLVDGTRVILPDWLDLDFLSLPPIESNGEIIFPRQIIRQLGYDPSRIWQAGQTADTYMMLGDFAESFHLQEFALKNIGKIVGFDLSTLNLKDYELISWQTAETLTEAIPGLERLPLGKVKPLYELLVSKQIPINEDSIIGDVIQQYEIVKDLPLGELGEDLAEYDLKSIPGLSQTPLKEFGNWQKAFINQIPGLNQVPFALFPLFFGNVGFSVLGKADVVFSQAEHGDPGAAGYFISGSAVGNSRKPRIKPVDCEPHKPCSYLELTDFVQLGSSLTGKRLGSAETQTVKGGFGPLKLISGKEPTGLLPYGPAFKVALTGVNESQGQADFGLYFRACQTIFLVGHTCTAYSIGPIPWIPVREKDVVVIAAEYQSVRLNLPENYRAEIASILAKASIDNSPSCLGGCVEGDGKTTGAFSHPIARGTRVSSAYGWRRRPFSNQVQHHNGIDYAAPLGTAVKSVDGGIVVKVSSNSCPDFGNSKSKRQCGGELGNYVDVKLNNGKTVRYGHLQQGSIKVTPGMKVSQGQTIAGVGSSGWSTGPHLDLRIRDSNGYYENPDTYIRR